MGMTDVSQDARVGWGEVLNKECASPLILVCLGIWLHAADALIVATMMPSIVAEIGGAPYVGWTIALYEIGSIVAGAMGAILVLRMGLRRPMTLAALTFAIGCLTSAASSSMAGFLAGRLLQGLGGGGLSALAFIATTSLFTPRLTARVMAIISVLWGTSAFLGPLIGGMFVQHSTWHMGFVFFGAQGLALAGWINFRIRIPDPARDRKSAPDAPIVRLSLLALGVVLIATAGIDVSFPRTVLLLAAGLAVLALFLRLDARRPATRLLPHQPFNIRTPIGAAQIMNLTMSVATIGLAAYGPLLMTVIHGASALAAGYVLACEAIGWTLAAILLSGAPERHDPFYIFSGMALVAAGVGAMIFAIPHGPLPLIALAAAVQGGGFGAAWTFVLRRARRLVAADDLERLSGAMSVVGHFGYALGAALLGIVANAAGFAIGNSVAEASTVARWIFTACLPIALLGLFAAGCFVRPPRAAPMAPAD
jgi:MFS family permease